MNASEAKYPPREIAKPPGLQTVEICSRSGLLATDKCYDTVKGDAGESVQKRTTYREIATPAQMPLDPCDVHGDARGRIVRDLPEGEWPRAALAVDTARVQPVIAKAATLIADADPYNAVRSTSKPKTEVASEKSETDSAAQNDLPDPTKPVMKAQPVTDADRAAAAAAAETPVEIRRAQPVHPMDQVPDNEILLKPTPPPTLDLGNQ